MKDEIKEIKGMLKHGDQRIIARRMGEHPARVSDALNGFISKSEFLERLAAEAKALISEHSLVSTI